jgi:hypothetical protein
MYKPNRLNLKMVIMDFTTSPPTTQIVEDRIEPMEAINQCLVTMQVIKGASLTAVKVYCDEVIQSLKIINNKDYFALSELFPDTPSPTEMPMPEDFEAFVNQLAQGTGLNDHSAKVRADILREELPRYFENQYKTWRLKQQGGGLYAMDPPYIDFVRELKSIIENKNLSLGAVTEMLYDKINEAHNAL